MAPPSRSMSTIQQAKKTMRKQVLATLANIPPPIIEQQSKVVTNLVISSPYYQSAKRLSVFLSLPNGEINTDPIILHALNSGRSVFIPYCKPIHADMRMLRLSSIEDFKNLEPNKWNIREFATDEGREEALDGNGLLDLVLVPGVAFDTDVNRLGHGRGYYDRYLQRCRTRAQDFGAGPPTSIAVALTEQILSPGVPVPTTVNDIKPDMVFHPHGELGKLNAFGG